jgi:hypothetical protein
MEKIGKVERQLGTKNAGQTSSNPSFLSERITK